MPQPEYIRVVKPCMTWLKKNGYMAWKNHGGRFGHSGLPDIMALRDGRLYAFECKLPGQVATKLQQRTLDQLAGHGATAEVVTCVEDMIRCLPDQ